MSLSLAAERPRVASVTEQTTSADPVTDPLSPRARDEDLRSLYEEHAAVLLAFLTRRLNGDLQRAEDILQETLLRAWRHPEAQGPDGSWSRAWLFTVARRIVIDHTRAMLIRPSELGDHYLAERPGEVDDYERLVDVVEVRDALAALSERHRDVIILVHFRQHTVAEAAAMLGVPEGTVKSRTFAALAAMRQILAARGYIIPRRRPA